VQHKSEAYSGGEKTKSGTTQPSKIGRTNKAALDKSELFSKPSNCFRGYRRTWHRQRMQLKKYGGTRPGIHASHFRAGDPAPQRTTPALINAKQPTVLRIPWAVLFIR